jgi:hypothetical protein
MELCELPVASHRENLTRKSLALCVRFIGQLVASELRLMAPRVHCPVNRPIGAHFGYGLITVEFVAVVAFGTAPALRLTRLLC